MKKGIFTISLDFELFWGVRDHRSMDNYGENIRNVHEVVPELLELFDKYSVHCTWATVGILFCTGKNELLGYLPAQFPDYRKKEYDPYPYIRENDLEQAFHFAPGLISRIIRTPGQEIGTHTFSHFYALEKNTNIEQFTSDIQAARKIAEARGVKLNSIVFPRNQYSPEHIMACSQEGIHVYRGNESSTVYKPVSRDTENFARRAVRFFDAYLNLTGHHCHEFPGAGEIINVPASRFLRPYHPKLKMLDGLRLSRIKKSLRFAAEQGRIYHLWWHPHNFGKHQKENLHFLEQVLKFYTHLNQEGKMISLNLSEIYSMTNNQPTS